MVEILITVGIAYVLVAFVYAFYLTVIDLKDFDYAAAGAVFWPVVLVMKLKSGLKKVWEDIK